MKKPTKKCIESLERITARLEQWQARNGQHDPTGMANAAKSELMRLIRRLEAENAEK